MFKKPKIGQKVICVKIPYFWAEDSFTAGNTYEILSSSLAGISYELDDIIWITNDKTKYFSIGKESWDCFVPLNATTKALYGT